MPATRIISGAVRALMGIAALAVILAACVLIVAYLSQSTVIIHGEVFGCTFVNGQSVGTCQTAPP